MVTLGLAVFLTLLYRRKRTYLPYVLFVWSISVSYSRIYLGVHYPFDVLCGWALGAALAFAVYKVYLYFSDKYFPNAFEDE